MQLGDRFIGPGYPCFVVAEIGQNHDGEAYKAKALIEMAARAGADAVKFTKRDIESDLTAVERERAYDSPFGKTYGEHREALELGENELEELLEYAAGHGLYAFCTACDIPSVELLERIGNPVYKIASRDADNGPLLEAIAKTGKPIILSTGMSSMPAVVESVAMMCAVDCHAHTRLVALHCLSQYPAESCNVNLRAMEHMRGGFGHNGWDIPVGYSDHTPGLTTAVAAATLGACVVEKHITLNRASPGSDHAAALEENGLKLLVARIREMESAMGDTGCKVFEDSCLKAKQKLGRSLTTTVDIPAGTQVEEEMVCLKSPGWGIQWKDRGKVIGGRSAENIPADATIQHGEVKRTVAVLAARMGSERFPGKMMAEIGGVPMFQRVVEQVRLATEVDYIIAAMPDAAADNGLKGLADRLGVVVHLGHPTDVLERVTEAAGWANASVIVRILCDCPLTDPKYIDQVALDIRRGGAQYVGFKLPDGRTMHEAKTGLFPEAVMMKALRKANKEFADPAWREHVTLGIYSCRQSFACRWLTVDVDPELRLSVDTPEDLERVRAYGLE